MQLFLLLLALFSFQAAAATPGEAINLDIGTPPVVIVKHSLAQRASRLVHSAHHGWSASTMPESSGWLTMAWSRCVMAAA